MHNNQNQDIPEQKIGSIMIYLMWITLIGVLAILMQGWLDKRHNPNSELNITGTQELVLQRNPYGHYVASGYVNGSEALFMLDTGATDVVIPEKLAIDFKLQRGYPIQVRTANGTVTVYTTRLERVTLGPIELYNVQASINPHMEDDEVLLGMSFLKHLSLTQVRDQLIISQP